MKNNYLIIALFAIISINLQSCETSDFISEAETDNTLIEPLTKAETLKVFQSMDIDKDVCSEIHSFILDEIDRGEDEIVLINKILSASVRSKANYKEVLKDKLLDLSIISTRSDSYIDPTTLLDKFSKSNISIYWPYSEDWNGKELPTLVVGPENEDIDECLGWVPMETSDGLRYDSMMIDESYAMQHPVWIIKDNHFEDINSVPSILKETASRSSGATSLTPWQATYMQVTHQYDSWIAGASEFEINVAYPMLAGYASGTSTHHIRFTRGEIKSKVNKKLTDFYLNTNWRPEQITNYLLIIETDDGGDKKDIPVSVKYEDKESGVSFTSNITFTIHNHDEIIAKQNIDREFMKYKGAMSFDNGNVNITMPIIEIK